MAYEAQKNFLKMRFPHELAFLPDTSQFIAKSYGPCSDPRSWSLDHHERSQYYLELLSIPIEREPVIIDEDTPPERQRRPRPPAQAGQAVGGQDELNAKNKEIDDLQRRLKELENQLKAGAPSGSVDGKSSDDCKQELDRLRKELEKKNGELEQLKKEGEKSKADLNQELEKAKRLSQPGTSAEDCSKLREENEKLKKDLQDAKDKASDLEKQYGGKERADDEKDKLKKDIKEGEPSVGTNKPEEDPNLEKKDLNKSDDATAAQRNEQLAAAQAQNAQLNQEIEDLRRQLMECNKKRESGRPGEPDSGNESDRGARTDRSEDCDAIRRERDCLRSKFCQLEPELLCLSNMVRDFECLEDRYFQLRGELEERETREIALMNRLQLLLQMESEFYALQKRVCESEKLLKQYQAKNSITVDLPTPPPLPQPSPPQNEIVRPPEIVVTNLPVNQTVVDSNVTEDQGLPKPAIPPTKQKEAPKPKESKAAPVGNKCQSKATSCQTGTGGKCDFPLDELIQTTQATIIAVRTNLQSTTDEKNLAKKLYFGLKNLVKSYDQNYCKFQCGEDDEYDDECNWCTLDYLIVANDEFVKLKLIRECETSNSSTNTVCSLQLKVFNLTSCISDLNDIVENQKNDLALARCEVSGLEDQIRVLRKNIEIERNEYGNIQSQQKVQQLECLLKSKNCEIEKLQTHMKSMDSNLCRMTTQFKELEHNLANARTANNVLKQNYKELTSTFSCQKSEVSDKAVELLKLRKKYECLSWDNKILNENISCLTEKLRNNDNSMNCSAIQMNEKLNQLMCENQKLKNEVRILNENLNEINCLLSAYECEKHREVDLVKVLDNIDASLTQLSQPCDGSQLDVAPECRDMYENLSNTIQKLIKQLEIEQMKNANLEKQIIRYKKDLECQPDASDCQKKIFELQAKLQLYDATNYEKILQIENLKREVKFLSGPSDDIQNENQKLLKSVEELNMELKYAMARIAAFEKCELLSERNGKLCERSAQTETKEPTFDLAKLKSLYEKEVNNISKSHCDGLRTLQSLHEMQTCDLRRDHETEVKTLRNQIEMLRAHLTNFARGGSDTVLSERPKTCVCACNGIPPLKKNVANKIEVICKRILNCGVEKLTFDELCYIHEQIYTAALRLQNVNETGRSTLKKQRSQLENRIKYIEKELKKFRNLLEKLKELQKQKRKLLNSAPPNTRGCGSKLSPGNT